MKVFEGKSGIKATILCDSVNPAGVRLTTYELEYPRIIHSELMTHRMLSRNAASSRAIPASKMLEQLTAKPVRFGANVAGMQDGGEHDGMIEGETFDLDGVPITPCYFADEAWSLAREDAVKWSTAFAKAGYHKQVFNRLTEPFSMIKVVATATEWDNFFWLRNDTAADPTLHELAQLMNDARQESVPQLLEPGEWHLPYIDTFRSFGRLNYSIETEANADGETTEILELEDAIKVSCARCAAVSFRNVDYGVEKSREVYDRLVGSERKHASAFEHCATPINAEHEGSSEDDWTDINLPRWPDTWENGITHMDRDGNLWSGNLKGFIQYRKLIPGENYTK